MASFLERYHQFTKYDPRTIDKAAQVRFDDQPEPWKAVSGSEHVDLRPHLTFLTGAGNGGGDWSYPVTGALDLPALARLSWFAAGVSGISNDGILQHVYRTNPSAGGLYPVEFYWAIFDVPGIDSGIWLFHAPTFALVPVWKGDFRGDFKAHFLGNPALETAGALALLTGIFERGRWRYQERAWRRILLDAGHLEGNLLEASAREGLESMAISAFADEGVGDLLFPDEGEVPLLGVAIGQNLDKRGPRVLKSPTPPPKALQQAPETGHMQDMAHALGNIPVGFRGEPVPEGEWVQVEGSEYLPLPKGGEIPGTALAAVLRRSCRIYDKDATISLENFGKILAWSFAPLIAGEGQTPPGSLLYWIVTLGVEGLEPGIWHYDPAAHAVAPCRLGHFREACKVVSIGQDLARDAAFLLFQTCELGKAVELMGERSYRPLCLDAGLVGERLNLAAQALGLGSSGIGGYFDDLGNELLLRPLSEALLYATTVGVPA